MQTRNTKPKAHYRIPQMHGRFPLAAFLALLCIGFLCLFAASTMQPNYGAMYAYRNDPAYLVTSRVFLKMQTLSGAIFAGNTKTLSELSSLAHKIAIEPTPHQPQSLQRRKLPKK
jgi:hypothetical protein